MPVFCCQFCTTEVNVQPSPKPTYLLMYTCKYHTAFNGSVLETPKCNYSVMSCVHIYESEKIKLTL